MIKIMHTGDQHIGMKYNKYESEIAEILQQTRLDALQKTVEIANAESCDLYVVSGDLFDNIRVSVKLQEQVFRILGAFDGEVLVIPGNHDYCDEESGFWMNLQKYAASNTVLCTELHRYQSSINGKDIVVYPCGCSSRYANDNMLGWVKDICMDTAQINIGIAHGAIEGLSQDSENKYFRMTLQELQQIPVDLWLIGHTHIPYPVQAGLTGQKIFNAGTHQQTDIANNTTGNAFIIEIGDNKAVSYRFINPGIKRFVKCVVDIQRGEQLETKLNRALSEYDASHTILRLEVKGIVSEEEYAVRDAIYAAATSGFFYLDGMVDDSKLRKEVTEAVVLRETMEGTIERELLNNYLNDMELLNLAYELVKECKGDANNEN